MEWQFPEFILLAIPLWYALFRQRAVPGESAWLLTIPLWLLFIHWDIPVATGLLAEKQFSGIGDALVGLQRYSGWLLPVVCWFGLRKWARSATVTDWLRFAIVCCLLLCLGGPKINWSGKGIDVILVIDRSRSLPEYAVTNIAELQETLNDNRQPGDRLGIVSFGQNSRVEQLLTEHRLSSQLSGAVHPDGSDLNDAILKALSLVDPNRPARIFVMSDGEANGPSPGIAARRAREANVPIDYRLFERMRVGDVAVKSLDLPKEVSPNERFIFSAMIYADSNCVGRIRLFHEQLENGRLNRKLIAEKTETLRAGNNRVLFAHALQQSGSQRYDIDVDVDNDPLIENNTGTGALRVRGAPRLLLLVRNEAAKKNRLAQLLTDKRFGLTVDVRVARQQPLTKKQLDRYRGLILENVPASDLGHLKMSRIAQFVNDRGLGLMLTGGENSFGTGGYFKSPLDKLLPVSMEMREDDRKTQVAIAVLLDRSGSMGVMVGGRTKMELANIGTAECANILSARDRLTVISVDTTATVNVPLTNVRDKTAIQQKIHGITVGGGGIYVDVALKAARKELDKVKDIPTRHIILFSDASDTEISPQPLPKGVKSRYLNLLKQVKSLKTANITISVIGLGEPTDQHAQLLKQIAATGGGEVMFTNDARDLPRLFAQDTMKIARRTFIRKSKSQPAGIPGRRIPGPYLIGQLGQQPFPNVDGYNVSYLRTDAQSAAISKDEYKAPWSAFWNRGLGRVAAITLDVSGKYAGAFANWSQAKHFLLTHTRWLLGGDDPRNLYVDLKQNGQEAIVTIELDDPLIVNPTGMKKLELPVPQYLQLISPGQEVTEARKIEFQWIDRNRLQARFQLDRQGIFYTTIVAADSAKEDSPKNDSTTMNRRHVFPGPSIALPYSPEFAPRDGLPTGRQTLQSIAKITGGQERTDLLELFAPENRPQRSQTISLLPYLVGAILLLLLMEIAGRRLALWPSLQRRCSVFSRRLLAIIQRKPFAAESTAASHSEKIRSEESNETANDSFPVSSRRSRWWPQWKLRSSNQTTTEASASDETTETASETKNSNDKSPTTPTVETLWQRAKQRTRNRPK